MLKQLLIYKIMIIILYTSLYYKYAPTFAHFRTGYKHNKCDRKHLVAVLVQWQPLDSMHWVIGSPLCTVHCPSWLVNQSTTNCKNFRLKPKSLYNVPTSEWGYSTFVAVNRVEIFLYVSFLEKLLHGHEIKIYM